ncbi:hypothetical protein Z043_116372 [Scleropages formosus]|uniref:SSD domain-containing protein n=1 Tax=Scleropages formosus TaxID=113540 RepID=A0A0P7YFB7_SCLFO|nr:hypothetical protein Z043_116372 [Scleropages formosus]
MPPGPQPPDALGPAHSPAHGRQLTPRPQDDGEREAAAEDLGRLLLARPAVRLLPGSHHPLHRRVYSDLLYRGPPVAYIQQVLVKAAVSPWDNRLVPVDAFRSPLGRVFSLLDEIRNHVHSDRFLGSLRSRLKQLHPSANCSLREEHMVHVHFKEEIGVAELIPLVTTYIILFAYIYFSTRKIDMVKSKWGLALAAVVTVLSSLLMSVGLCTLFGLTPTLNGGEIFPYLVVVIGLENVLVLTKSVVSTPVDLEVKLRIAQVGLVSDFFLQMLFFTTVLSIDIRRMEISWGPEDEEGWRRLSYRHWPSFFSYYNITLAKRWACPPRARPREVLCGSLLFSAPCSAL